MPPLSGGNADLIGPVIDDRCSTDLGQAPLRDRTIREDHLRKSRGWSGVLKLGLRDVRADRRQQFRQRNLERMADGREQFGRRLLVAPFHFG